ncbi:hypothetical protein MLAC_25980 [Mycobacterium lacus]|uniref:Uncharacterized protein n=1 Tax=Mycobacterium lacus TaxID=169765 RepID=A0A7I7NL24_9MYCO|nr:hypothetical protein MLAC_25980 [Mycobacterium lacus]
MPRDSSAWHDVYWASAGVHDVGTGTFYAGSSLPFKQPLPPGPVPIQTSYLPLPNLPSTSPAPMSLTKSPITLH